jgi:hypothetical protein
MTVTPGGATRPALGMRDPVTTTSTGGSLPELAASGCCAYTLVVNAGDSTNVRNSDAE